MNGPVAVLLTAFVATVFCTAVNCYTLRIAYPLWRFTGPPDFAALHKEYLRRLGPIITFPHIVMFFAAAALLRWRPRGFTNAEAAALFLLETAVILVSAVHAGAIHTRFTRTGMADEPGLARLIQISALRSVLMIIATAILCRWLAHTLAGV